MTRGKGARVKQEHNISNNKMLLYDAANLAAFLYRLKNFFKRNYVEIVETIRLKLQYHRDPERAEQIKQIKGW